MNVNWNKRKWIFRVHRNALTYFRMNCGILPRRCVPFNKDNAEYPPKWICHRSLALWAIMKKVSCLVIDAYLTMTSVLSLFGVLMRSPFRCSPSESPLPHIYAISASWWRKLAKTILLQFQRNKVVMVIAAPFNGDHVSSTETWVSPESYGSRVPNTVVDALYTLFPVFTEMGEQYIIPILELLEWALGKFTFLRCLS